jgi:hypothetical protein
LLELVLQLNSQLAVQPAGNDVAAAQHHQTARSLAAIATTETITRPRATLTKITPRMGIRTSATPPTRARHRPVQYCGRIPKVMHFLMRVTQAEDTKNLTREDFGERV